MKTYGQYCAAARALDIVGDRWVLLIVRELLQGPSRFTDLRAGLPGIATNLLAARLKEMEDNGLITRADAPPPVATGLYELTARGQQLRPVIEALADWGMPTMPVQHDGDAVHGSWLGLLAQTRLRDTRPERGPLTIAIDTDQMPVHLLSSRDDGWLDLRRGRAAAADVRLSGAAPLVGGYLSGLLSLAQARGMGLRVDGDEAALSRLTSRDREPPGAPGERQRPMNDTATSEG
jgi:DNA-binding HxlR family transcriptional regulator